MSGAARAQRPKWLIEIQDWLLSTEYLYFNVTSSFDLNHDISKGRFEFRRAHSWRRHFEGVWGREKRPPRSPETILLTRPLSWLFPHHPARDWVHSRLSIKTWLSMLQRKKCSRVTEKQLDRIKDMIQIIGPQNRSLLLAFVSCIQLQRSLVL